MSLSSSTTSQIRAQVASIHKKVAQAKVIGIKTSGKWQGEEKELVNGQEFRFLQCDSVLQIREVLAQSEVTSLPLVIITDLNDSDVGLDVLARFAKRRLHMLHPWPILLDLFQARKADPKLLEKRWLAEALLENVPAQGYKPVPSGVLDEETVWGILLRQRLGFEVTRPDTHDLLAWSLNAEGVAKYLSLPRELRQGIQPWIVQSAGKVSELIFGCIDSGYGQDAAAIGLACHVVFSETKETQTRNAAVRLERFTDNRPIPPEDAMIWAAAAAIDLKKKILVERRISHGKNLRA